MTRPVRYLCLLLLFAVFVLTGALTPLTGWRVPFWLTAACTMAFVWLAMKLVAPRQIPASRRMRVASLLGGTALLVILWWASTLETHWFVVICMGATLLIGVPLMVIGSRERDRLESAGHQT